jgi:hypothetical protein
MEMGLWESLDNSILPAHSSYYKVSKSRDILYLFYIIIVYSFNSSNHQLMRQGKKKTNQFANGIYYYSL